MTDPTPRIHGLHDFRMQDVSYEIRALTPGEILERAPGVAGYFYHVLDGVVEVSGGSGPPFSAARRDTVVVSGYVGHQVRSPGVAHARLLIGSEPFEHLAWLGRANAITCHRGDSGHPLLKRLHLAMDLVIEELSSSETRPDQLTLERTAELIIFYFFRMDNPVTGELEPFPWSDPRLRRVIAAITARPERNWTIDQLAQIATMSRSAFSARFKALLGETPMHFLAAVRLKSAAQRMLAGQRITEAANEAGYGSEEAFNRAFKRHFGTTPGRWIRNRRPHVQGSG